MKYFGVLVVVGSLLFTACDNNTSSGDLGIFDAIIKGTITYSNGSDVRGAEVLITSHLSECDNIQEGGISHGISTTDSDGTFRKRIQKPTKDTIRSLTLNIKPNTNSSLNDTMVSISTILELKNSTPFNEEEIEIAY